MPTILIKIEETTNNFNISDQIDPFFQYTKYFFIYYGKKYLIVFLKYSTLIEAKSMNYL